MNTRVLLTMIFAILVAMLGIGIIIPVLPIYAEDLGATATMLALMVAGFSISRGILQPFAGSLSDIWGRKAFLMLGLVVYTIAGFAYTLADSVAGLMVIRIVHGGGSAMIIPIAMSYVASVAPLGQEGRYMGSLNVALFAGIGAGPVMGGICLDHWGEDSAFYAMTALSAASALLVLIALPADGRRPTKESGLSPFPTFKRVLKRPRMGIILIGRITSMFALSPTMSFLPLLMADDMRASATEIGIVLGVRTASNALFQTPMGAIADHSDKGSILIASGAFLSVTILAVPFLDSVWQLAILFTVVGAAEAAIWATLGAMAAEEGRVSGYGAVMGLFGMAMSVGVVIGSLLAGLAADTFDGYENAFFAASALVAVGTAVVGASLQLQRARGAANERAL